MLLGEAVRSYRRMAGRILLSVGYPASSTRVVMSSERCKSASEAEPNLLS